jgi:hypothetical protein
VTALAWSLPLAVGIAVAAVVVAVWDAVRRALATQVRQAELRVEAMRREDVAELADALQATQAQLAALEGELQSVRSAVTLHRATRR